MSGAEEARHLLRMANTDLRAVRGMEDDETTFSDEVFGFHAQQAVEKALKAWLCLLGVVYPKTHDLDLLFELLDEAGAHVPDEYQRLSNLVDFAVQYRYWAFEDTWELERTATARAVASLLEFVARKVEEAGANQGE
ncbi:MAG: HEPN domain-containing protein [Planctomycetota bacterium]